MEEGNPRKIWNCLMRYFYQKVTPSHLFAVMIIIGLCENNEEVAEGYALLDPENDYELVPVRNNNNPTRGGWGNAMEYLKNVGGFCYKLIKADDILMFMRRADWGTQYVDAVTKIIERRRSSRTQNNTTGSSDLRSNEDGNTNLLTDPVTECEIAKEILTYLRNEVSCEDILSLMKTTRWSESYVGSIEEFIKMYQSGRA